MSETLLSDHQPYQRADIEAAGGERLGDRAALAHHRDAVGNGEDLLQPVRDEDQAAAPAGEVPHHAEQPLALHRRKRRSRLVENDDATVDSQRLQDLHDLELAGAERADGRLQRELDFPAERGQKPLHLPAQLSPVEPPRHAEARQHDVLHDGEIRREGRLLRDHANAVAQGIPRAGKAQRPAVERDLARVWADLSRDHARQRRFPRSVRAAERVDFAGGQGELCLRERLRGAEALADAAEFEQTHGAVTLAALSIRRSRRRTRSGSARGASA